MKSSKKLLDDYILIHNTRENNLKNLSLKIPKNSYVMITGKSGSGKSSLVHQVIGAEAKRRYLEQMNPRVRSLMAGIKRPDFEKIEGLTPVISLDQISANLNIRSTVGTISGLYDYFRLLFARYGTSEEANRRLNRSNFSFNSEEGQCKHCNGIGNEEYIDPETFILDPNKSIKDGALSLTTPNGYVIYSQVTLDVLEQVCRAEGFSLDLAWAQLSEKQRDIIFYGSEAIKVPFGKHTLESRMKWTGITAKPREEGYYRGILTIMEEILKRDRNKNILKYTKSRVCPICSGYRLNRDALKVVWQGMNIGQWSDVSITDLELRFDSLMVNDHLSSGEYVICQTINTYLHAIGKLGIGHLSLSREARSLSRGESKRIQLSALIRPEMSGVMYTLDEPTVGLHPKDHNSLLNLLQQIRNNGNSIICIDHKLPGFKRADYWIEFGPDAGKNGGQVIVEGWLNELISEEDKLLESTTWPYLTGDKHLLRTLTKLGDREKIRVQNATKNNLKKINPYFFEGALNIICGVSGSGKSSLLNGVIHDALLSKSRACPYGEVFFTGDFNKVIQVNQEPIGRTPRSNPVTYIKVFDQIRELFANLPESKARGFTKSHFSFNVEGGRCPKCFGAGKIELGLSYLGRIETDCDLCLGKRFNSDVLDINYRNMNISEILDMEVDAAVEFFTDEAKVCLPLNLLQELGLGYLKLGQSSSTLSGGEAQRIKLVAELSKGNRGKNLYLLDEPTNGLHYDDIAVLLAGLDKLLEQGSTIIAVEHDPFLIEVADWIVELGPGAGSSGGEVVFMGTSYDLVSGETLMGQSIIQAKADLKMDIPAEKSHAPVFDMELLGVTTHNLKNLNFRIPVNKITCVTGLSGSGKTSFAFDSLYDQSRFLFSQVFSPYVRTLIAGNRPIGIEESRHILPSVGIRYRMTPGNNFSTVGSLLGIISIVRLLFARFSIHENGTPCTLWARHFSYMDNSGACHDCEGKGFILSADESTIVTNPENSIRENAFSSAKPVKFFTDVDGQYYAIFKAMASVNSINPDFTWNKFDARERGLILYGTGAREYDILWEYNRKGRKGQHAFRSVWKGFINLINEDYLKKKETTRATGFSEILHEIECSTCQGKRLLPERQSYRLFDQNIGYWSEISINELDELLSEGGYTLDVQFDKQTARLIRDLIDQLRIVISNIKELGLGYLSLIRRANTLSTGEFQRVRLLGQINSGLSGILYVVDEPGASLHAENILALARLFEKLKAKGNTIVFTDHRPELIRKADYLIELGPGSGSNGGEIQYQGTPEYHENLRSTAITPFRRTNNTPDKDLVTIFGISDRNLKIKTLWIPAGWTSISGVSGSGKSTLLNEAIHKSLVKSRDDMEIVTPNETGRIWHWSKTPLSVVGLDTALYKQFAETADAKADGLKYSDFRPGSKKFGCPKCQSRGYISEHLDFLGDNVQECSACKGTGYIPAINKYFVNGYRIFEVLKFELCKILEFLRKNDQLIKLKQLIEELGLNYIESGQHGNHLSEGEKQRLLLVKYLYINQEKPVVFLFDEPTKGLHPENKEGFVSLIHRLADAGHSIITIDHDKELIRCADWNICLGPGAGDQGGLVVYEGVPK